MQEFLKLRSQDNPPAVINCTLSFLRLFPVATISISSKFLMMAEPAPFFSYENGYCRFHAVCLCHHQLIGGSYENPSVGSFHCVFLCPPGHMGGSYEKRLPPFSCGMLCYHQLTGGSYEQRFTFFFVFGCERVRVYLRFRNITGFFLLLG
jgi:hypothetical protein